MVSWTKSIVILVVFRHGGSAVPCGWQPASPIQIVCFAQQWLESHQTMDGVETYSFSCAVIIQATSRCMLAAYICATEIVTNAHCATEIVKFGPYHTASRKFLMSDVFVLSAGVNILWILMPKFCPLTQELKQGHCPRWPEIPHAHSNLQIPFLSRWKPVWLS